MSNYFLNVMKRFNLANDLQPIEKVLPMTNISELERALLLAEKKYDVPPVEVKEESHD
jgi:hypothetical protein